MMDACSDPKIKEVVIMAGAQLGKSEVLLNIIGYHIDNDPSPILMLQPTESMAQAFSKDRIANGLLRSTPCLAGKVKDPRARDSNNTTLHKIFPGGSLSLVGANSPAGLASRPIRILLVDELDRAPASAGSEGDPLNLAKKRTATFWNRKIVIVSTPTNKGASRIEEAYLNSDQRKYYVPCQHCKEYQVLAWANVKWTDSDPKTARYLCDCCGSLWDESDRRWSVRNGEWRAQKEFKGIAGFHISGMYSPWTPLADGVTEFLAVKKNPEQLRVWVNTYLGESYEDKGEAIDHGALNDRREDFGGGIPDEVIFMTCGVDVQDNRLEMSVIGWGRDFEAYVIEHKTLYGDPSTPQLWTTLDSQLFKMYEANDGRQMPIRATCVDSGGHFTNTVYSYCKKHAGRRIFAIKEGAGYIHFSHDLDDEYFLQLTAEKVITKYHRGFKKRMYVKTRPRNEALDCMVYSIAAYAIINIDVNSLADRRDLPEVEEPVNQRVEPVAKPFVPRTGSGFVNSWR
jgi:phage terminase large subunit GpA-like protein